MEVRFGEEGAVRRAVREAVEDGLLDHGLLRSSAPRGRSAPDETELPGESSRPSPKREEQTGGPAAQGDRQTATDASGESTTDTFGDTPTTTGGAGPPTPGGDGSTGSGVDDESGDPSGRIESAADANPTDVADPSGGDPARIRDPGSQSTLGSGTTDRDRDFERLPDMRVLGQVAETYVVAESDDGLLLIDQHAADERVNYERLQDRLDSPATQALADPVTVELTAREAELFPAFSDALAELGFRAERAGDRSVEVTAVPGVFSDAFDPERLRDVLGEFLEGTEETSVDTTVEDLLADLACYPSVTGNTSLTEGSVHALLAALDDCENPYACPHGRPVVIEIDHGEIDDRFERDYPGHGAHHE